MTQPKNTVYEHSQEIPKEISALVGSTPGYKVVAFDKDTYGGWFMRLHRELPQGALGRELPEGQIASLELVVTISACSAVITSKES